jgi:hypothetical protein
MLRTNFGSYGQAVSEQKIFKKSINKQNCFLRPCLLTDQDEMCNLYRGPSIGAFYQVSFYLAKRLQRKQIEKSTNQKQELPVAAMFFNGSERNVQSL